LKEAAQPEYQDYTRRVIANARALAAGLRAQGIRPVSGGTDTHLALLDIRSTGVTGAEAETRCDAASITLNKNVIPFDPAKPMVASGIRVGTPSVTTQGMDEADMTRVAGLIGRAVRSDPSSTVGKAELEAVAAEVDELVAEHPAYPRAEHPRAGQPAGVQS
jgi:glycine hydroxymethyltransferase